MEEIKPEETQEEKVIVGDVNDFDEDKAIGMPEFKPEPEA